MPQRFPCQCSLSSASSYFLKQFSSAGTRKAFREIRSQKCMWVNNALQFGKGHSLSSTEINITGVWKAMLRALGTQRGQTPHQAWAPEPRPSHHLSGTPCRHIFASLLWLTSWLISSAPPPALKLETNHTYVKTTSELFPSQATPEYKTCSEKLHHSLEKFYDLVTAACAAPWPG